MRHIRRTVRMALALATVSTITSAWAQSTDQQYKLRIERQPFKAALTDFAQQTGLNVSFLSDRKLPVNSDVWVGPLEGRYTADSALSAIVADTEFMFVHLNATTIAVERKASPKLRLTRLDTQGQPTTAATRPARAAPQRAVERRRFDLGDVEEVIVTAQKREQNLQDVPISISVLGGEELDAFTARGVTEALRSVPGVTTTVHHQGGGTQISVRGVAANGVLFRGSSPVAYYLDSAPFGMVKSAAAPDANVYDLERVEVLRGPQGTLYGASAQNGVVRILTKDANPGQFELKARTSASTTEEGGNNYRGDVAINAPVIEDRLAIRAVGDYEDLSGWIDKPNKRDANDGELRNMRLKINGKPSDKAAIGLSAWFSRTDNGAQSASADGRTHFSLVDEPISTDYDVYSLKLGYDFSAFSVSSVTSYLEYDNFALEDLRQEGFEGEVTTQFWSKVFSQEVVANSSAGGSWRWSAGAFYRDAKDRLRQDIVPEVPFFGVGDLSESFALFGELTRLFMGDRLELTGGLRYFEDDVTQAELFPDDGDFTRPLIRTNRTFDKVSPRAVLTLHLNERSTIYASYAEGFRSGFNQYANITRRFPQFPAVKPDNLKNYEVGAKGSLWDGRFGYDIAVYYLDWQDVQLVRSLLIDGIFRPGPLNGDSASGPGFEFALTAEPADGLQLSLNFSWNDLTSDSEVLVTNAVLFEKGDRLNYSPEITAGGSLDYGFALGSSGFEGLLSASATYMSEQTFHNVEGGVSVNYPGDSALIGRTAFSVQSPNHWSTTLFIDNVSNENVALLGGVFGDRDNAPRVRPRTVGLQLEYQF